MSRPALQHTSSILLLAIYLPMATVASVHLHHDTADLPDNCFCCSGHVDTLHHHHHDCPLCDFLNLFYTGQPTGSLTTTPTASECVSPAPTEGATHACLGASMLRAPPTA